MKDRYIFPLIEGVLGKLEGAGVFTTLDLKNGFFCVEIEEMSRKYTAFITDEDEYFFDLRSVYIYPLISFGGL